MVFDSRVNLLFVSPLTSDAKVNEQQDYVNPFRLT